MEIVVIEDNYEVNQIICDNINQALIENNLDYPIRSFFKYDNEVKRLIHNKEIKIYIIDIKLGFYSGYDVCREIREAAYDWDSIIIIASVHNQKENMISLRLSIFTYISKLNNFEMNLKDSVIDAVNILEQKKFLFINKNCKVSINDIYYIEKEKNSKYCLIKTLEEEFKIRRSLKSLEEALKMRKIKNYLLINDRNVKSITKTHITFKHNIRIEIN